MVVKLSGGYIYSEVIHGLYTSIAYCIQGQTHKVDVHTDSYNTN